MIVSASRRTDIPAFYSEWLVNRLQAGWVMVRNPLNLRQVSKISLSPELVDCVVFWTKDAAPLMKNLEFVESLGYSYYFQWTVTGYGRRIEPNLPKKSAIIRSFRELSGRIGPGRMVWRYDPVMVNSELTTDYHLRQFAGLCQDLQGYTDRCVFSYVDKYRKLGKRAAGLVDAGTNRQTLWDVAAGMAEIAGEHHISLEACCEEMDLSPLGIRPASCIDKRTIESITGYASNVQKAKGQRKNCGCAESVDIGAYDSCGHGCLYCYANSGERVVQENRQRHDSSSSLLIGHPCDSDHITERTMKSLNDRQDSLF